MPESPVVSPDDVDAYHRDGAVCLRGAFDAAWIDVLTQGLDRHLGDVTARARVWDRDDQGRTMMWDSWAWQRVPEYERFVLESNAAALAGSVMQSRIVNFFFDAVFVRSAGSQFETPWHQDEPYWSVEGYDTCTLWMPLVPVKAQNSLAIVPGTHLSQTRYDHYDFGSLNPDAKDDVDRSDFSEVAEAPVPDFSADPERYGVMTWDMEPGDCIVFNSRVMHGGSGRLPRDAGLSVFTSKWLGDDVRIVSRPEGMDPDLTDVVEAQGLRIGQRPEGQLFPRLWERAAS